MQFIVFISKGISRAEYQTVDFTVAITITSKGFRILCALSQNTVNNGRTVCNDTHDRQYRSLSPNTVSDISKTSSLYSIVLIHVYEKNV